MDKAKQLIDSILREGKRGTRVRFDDGSIMTTLHGTQLWTKNGGYHRLDGPAVVTNFGTAEWWVNGLPHRIDGPAVYHLHGPCKWYVNGRQFTEDEFNLYVDQTTGEVFVPPGKKLKYG